MPETITPVVPEQYPGQSTLNVQDMSTPWLSSWWTTQYLTNIPQDSVGWLVAQGWQITAATPDTSTTPATYTYAMQRSSLQNMYILQSLLNEYTFAYNTAKDLNETRYNQVVENWSEMLSTSQTHFDAEIDEQNAHAALFLGNLDTYMAEVDGLIEANQTQITTDAATATTALTAMDDKLANLETNATANASTVGGLLTNQESYLSTFLANFSSKLDELNSNYSTHLATMASLLSDADTDVETFILTQTPAIQSMSDAYTAHAQTLDGLLTTAGTYLTDISDSIASLLTSVETDYTDVEADIDTVVGECTTAFDSYSGDYDGVLALLASDYDTHSGIATGYLVDLGTTELARITEAFAASLSTQLQDLTDRGIYSSAVAVDITARNTRDRDEQITALNDRLTREKLENQHRLYGQQATMRAATMAGHDRSHAVQQEVLHYKAAQVMGLYQILQATRERTLNMNLTLNSLKDANLKLNVEIQSKVYELGQALQRLLIEEAQRLQQLAQSIRNWTAGQRDTLLGQIQQNVTQHLAGIDKQHAAQQDISRIAMGERDQLLGQLQDAVKGFVSGKQSFAAATMQTASTLAEHKHKIILEKMNEYVAKLEGRRGKHEEAMKLMAYQLSERNQMLVGLYSFVERREDVGPKFEELTKLATGLADSGGGWVTP